MIKNNIKKFRRINMKKINLHAGYTIIETMIAISLFLIVVTIGMGALLNANLIHRKSQDMRSIMDNLSFIMEDMSRNIRTGYNYYCGDTIDTGTVGDCDDGGVIVFEYSEGDTLSDSDQWVYQITLDGVLQRSTDGGGAGTMVSPQ